jgi:hypothetical protein
MVCLINIYDIKRHLNMSLNSDKKKLTIEGYIVEKVPTAQWESDFLISLGSSA